MKRNLIIIGLAVLLPMTGYAEHLFEAGVHGGTAGWIAMPGSVAGGDGTAGSVATGVEGNVGRDARSVAGGRYVETEMGVHGGIQLQYSYLSAAVIGFRIGATVDFQRAGFGKTNYEDSYVTTDVDGEQMQIEYNIGRLSEQYTIWSVGVPVQLALAYKGVHFYAGPKVVFPIRNSLQERAEHAALSVYYPAYDNRVYESVPLGASRDFEASNSGSLALPKIQWWLSAELSYAIPVNKWAMRYRSYIMVGAYFDYCFSPLSPAASRAESLLMLSDTRDGFPLQRVLTPVIEANRQGKKLVNECRMFDVGIKISYAISPYDAHEKAKKSCNCLSVY